jgi:4-hydroxyphenylpyruvate dioxygenase
VQLWEQGRVRVVVNFGEDSEVVAVAVNSSDPDASAKRAEALLAPKVERRRGPGEADLTAVEAPDGTAVFFCGDDWLDDFLRTDEDADPVGITHIDHITLAQPFDAFDEAGLFYRSVLDLRPSGSQELAAPDGLVGSRALANDGVRIILNIPALAGSHQGELQHVAFACEDALATARALRERGVPLLPVPGNYYDDLAARTGIDVAPLRALDVLYDRDAQGGELLHFYTARVGERVFFEFLERRGGYAGFGAANSPVRMAAQRAVLHPLTK